MQRTSHLKNSLKIRLDNKKFVASTGGRKGGGGGRSIAPFPPPNYATALALILYNYVKLQSTKEYYSIILYADKNRAGYTEFLN